MKRALKVPIVIGLHGVGSSTYFQAQNSISKRIKGARDVLFGALLSLQSGAIWQHSTRTLEVLDTSSGPGTGLFCLSFLKIRYMQISGDVFDSSFPVFPANVHVPHFKVQYILLLLEFSKKFVTYCKPPIHHMWRTKGTYYHSYISYLFRALYSMANGNGRGNCDGPRNKLYPW